RPPARTSPGWRHGERRARRGRRPRGRRAEAARRARAAAAGAASAPPRQRGAGTGLAAAELQKRSWPCSCGCPESRGDLEEALLERGARRLDAVDRESRRDEEAV